MKCRAGQPTGAPEHENQELVPGKEQQVLISENLKFEQRTALIYTDLYLDVGEPALGED